MSAVYYLGVDGGGTGTTAAVGDKKGRLVGMGKSGPSLYKVVGIKQAVINIGKAIREAERSAQVAPRPYEYAVFGLSGVDSLGDWKILSSVLHRNLQPLVRGHFRVVNDVVIALAAGTTEPYGAAVIAGTGSNAYAVGKHGEEAYAGGLGSVLADEGSAFAIGSAMLRAAVKCFDGRAGKSRIEGAVTRVLGVRHMRDAVNVVYAPSFDKTAIAALAPRCARLAKQGDKQAREIIAQAACDLAAMVRAVVKRARLANIAFDLVLSGNVFRAGAPYLNPFMDRVRRAAPRARIVRLHAEPAEGAIRLAQAAQLR